MEKDTTLRLKVPIGIPLSRALKAERSFLSLISDVGQSVAKRKQPVIWILDGITKGSVVLAVRGEPNDVTEATVSATVRAVARGLAILEKRPERPPHFTDQALQAARELAQIGDIAVGDGAIPLLLTTQLVANVDKVFGERLREIGSVEGMLEGLTIHGQRVFALYDRLTGARMECDFGHRIPAPEIGAAIGARVAVHGVITLNPAGDIAHVKAESLEVFPPSEDLPSAADVRGIFSRD